MSEIGKILKEAREKKNLDIEKIAKSLRVKKEDLESIEKKRELNADVFTIGYIRLYANYLKVNIDAQLEALKRGDETDYEEVIQEQVEEITSGVESILNKLKNPKYIKIASATIVTIIFVSGGFLMMNRKNSSENTEVQDVQKQKVSVTQQANTDISVTKLSDHEYIVKNISEMHDKVHVVVKDSTMLQFLDNDRDVIKEEFVHIGEKKLLPKGYNIVIVKSRISSAVDVVVDKN